MSPPRDSTFDVLFVRLLTFWKTFVIFFVTGVALRMSFAADQSAPMFPEPMNTAEIQLFIRVRNETLSVAAMCVCNPDRPPVAINR